MAIESKKNKQERAEKIYEILFLEFPDAKCALDHKNAFELLIATILSAQCTDVMVNRVTPDLFNRYPNPEELSKAPLEEVEECIKRIGLFRSKAKNIRSCAATLVQDFQSEVPSSIQELTSLAGVGRKTANVVLGNIFGINEGVVVDTHVNRISNHLKFTSKKDPVKIEKDLMRLFPQEDWTMLSHLLILHGRKTCIARRPRCQDCSIQELCPGSKKTS